ncbi:DNA damage-inducible protein DinB [Flavobacterium noncentrifugens]|uniref:Uncharacterized damage-inducible protein DinB (Forms a four-helix bundle) n=1 Tax=Flavobacterium noncentrifugens TaxID=1128970 RepID=A0A1G8SEZ6_9FLAO|nr:DinB family protein [Flavobacterium noncentrifugens]GEP49806.1 DNA damage-inducible protein DinB [Flavobacterium noncentrifugens]SDJ27799.1 Uncharacterized damage-inducible protein DinB (forms a four-helix bundle) [Flavobacterium noncentrifugens]
MDTLTTPQVINSEYLLKHWQGHRNLTRKVIDAFPENHFFEFTIGGMRTAAQLTAEILAMGAPALKSIVDRSEEPFSENRFNLETKAEYLTKWDESTAAINANWEELSAQDFHETFNLFGLYNFPVIQNIQYFIDNEIHHRGQMFVYLRALGITPPFFWER